MSLVMLPDFRLEVYLGKWEFAAKHHLTASDAESSTVEELLSLEPGAVKRLLDLRLQYIPTWGTDELRAAIAATYERVTAADVLAFAGAEEALFWALSELVGPGDHAIVTVPNYQSMESIPIATGAAVEGLVLRSENGFVPDPDELVRLLRKETKLVCLNFPNNPTGAVPKRDDFERMSELLAAIALRHHETLKSRCRAVLMENIALAGAFFARHSDRFTFAPPDGGSVCFPRYLGPDGVEAFTERALREAGVVLLPSSIYLSQLGTVPPNHFRLGLGRKDFAPGLAALERHLSE